MIKGEWHWIFTTVYVTIEYQPGKTIVKSIHTYVRLVPCSSVVRSERVVAGVTSLGKSN